MSLRFGPLTIAFSAQQLWAAQHSRNDLQQLHTVVEFSVVRSLDTPPPPGHSMVGGARLTEKFTGASFSISSVRQLLRQRCDARGFKPLLIEIIAREKVAPAFEPQNRSRWMDSSGLLGRIHKKGSRAWTPRARVQNSV
jgi:hypothetical protein